MRQEINKILTLLKKPSSAHKEEKIKHKFKSWFNCFLIILTIKLAYALVILITQALGYTSLMDIHNNQISLGIDNIYFSLLLIIVILPIIEEIVFRGPLTNHYLVISFSLILGLIYLIIFANSGIRTFFREINITEIVSYSIILLSAIILVKMKKQSISNFIGRYFSIVFYVFSVILFGIIHIFNFDFTSISNPIIPLVLTAPFFMVGAILGYVRVRNGLLWSMLLHISNNALILIPVLLIKG